MHMCVFVCAFISLCASARMTIYNHIGQEGDMKIYDGIQEKWTGSLDLSLKVVDPKIFGSFTLVIQLHVFASSMNKFVSWFCM